MTDPACKVSITIEELDANFNIFLKRLRSGENHAEKYGVAVIEELPPNYPLAPGGDVTKFEMNKGQISVAKSCKALECFDGIYYIGFERKKEAITWVQDREDESASASDKCISIESFVDKDLFDSLTGAIADDLTVEYPNLGEQSLFINLSQQKNFREFLRIHKFPVHSDALADRRFRAKDIESKTLRITKKNLRIACTSAPCTVGMNPVGLTSILFNHRGKPYEWIVIPPTEKESFEAHLRTHFRINPSTKLCPQFISHEFLWIPPSLLQTWGIKFSTVIQAENQMVVVFPDSYYWGFSHGFSMVEISLFAGEDWDPSNCQFCNPRARICREYERLMGKDSLA